MKRIFTLLTFFISILSVVDGYGQLTGDNYPVQAHVYVQRPSLKMPEYFSSSTMLRTDLILKDLTKTTLDVYLGWQITGLGLGVEAGTLPGFVPPGYLTLTKGSKRQLSGAELREYFQPGMLAVSGVGENVIFNGKLPEGFYTLKITAYEAGTGRQVSNTAETYFSVAYALPPVINLPLIGSEQPVTRPQSVLLQWMPRHTATGNNLIGYNIKVCPLAEDDEPNAAMTSQDCIDIHGHTATSVVLNASLRPDFLKVGKRYAFQVQAEDLNANLTFQNQGYSEVSWFRFGEACKPPAGLQVNAIAAGRLNVSWNANPQATGYKLLYRSKNQTEWTEQTTLGTSVSLVSLNPELDYEFKVITICEVGNESPESEIVTWEGEGEIDEELEILIKKVLNPEGEPIVSTTPGIQRAVPGIEKAIPSGPLPETFEDLIPKDPTKIPCQSQLHSYEECSDQHPEGHISTADKDLQTLKVGDLITIYDYLVVLTEVSGGNNIFSGKGLVKMPFLEDKKMPVEFSNVEIKQDQADQNGGCVTAVNGYFRVRTGLTPEQIRQEEIDLIHEVRTNTDPGSIYISRGQVITELSEELTTTGKDLCDGKPITEEAKQSLLKKHTLAKQGLQDWAENAADFYSELDIDGTEILSRIQALITTLEANIAIINSGEGCPQNPDVKTEMDAIKEKIKEDIEKSKEPTDNLPKITDVVVKNITESEATIIWKGDKRFTKYLVSYQTEGQGVVVKEVTGMELKLAELKEKSYYNIEIVGVSSENYQHRFPWFLGTLGGEFPKPKNLLAEDINSNTVKISWDADEQHKKYKLVYKDSNGEVKEAYPSGNSINIPNIGIDEHFTFEVIAYNQAGTKSASETNEFTSPSVCKSLNVTANRRSIIKGETVILELADRCEPGTIYWLKNGEEVIGQYGNTLEDKPFTTSVYKVTCEIMGFGTQRKEADVPYECSKTISIEVEELCESIQLKINPTSPALGEQVFISLTGCAGDVSLFKKGRNNILDKISDKSYLYYTVVENVEIFGKCTKGDESCMISDAISMSCTGFKIVSSPLNGVNYGSKQWGENVDRGLGFNSMGCTGYVRWNLHGYPSDRIEYNLGGYEVMILNIEKNESKLTKATATCSSNGCITEIELEKPDRPCAKVERKIEVKDNNGRAYYEMSLQGDFSKNGTNNVNWSPQLNKPIVIDNGKFYNYKYIDEVKSAEQYIATYYYLNSAVYGKYKTCDYSFVLNPEESKLPPNSSNIPFVIPCTPFKLSSTKVEITRGESVNLSTEGCPTSAVVWTTGKEGGNTPVRTTLFSAKCVNEVSTVTVIVNDPIFTVTPSEVKDHTPLTSLTITAKNCTDGYPNSVGEVTWSTSAKGSSITVRPEKSTEYVATCVVSEKVYGKGSCKVTVKDLSQNSGPLYPPSPCDFNVYATPNSTYPPSDIELTVDGCKGPYNVFYKGQWVHQVYGGSYEKNKVRVNVTQDDNEIRVSCTQNGSFCDRSVYLNYGSFVSSPPPIYWFDKGSNERLDRENCKNLYLQQKNVTYKFPDYNSPLFVPLAPSQYSNSITNKTDVITGWFSKGDDKVLKLNIADRGCEGDLSWHTSSSRDPSSQVTQTGTGAKQAPGSIGDTGYKKIVVPAPAASLNKITYYGRCVYPNRDYCDISFTLDKTSEKPLTPSGIVNNSGDEVQNIDSYLIADAENQNCGYTSTKQTISRILKELVCGRLKNLIPENPTNADIERLSKAVISTLESSGIYTTLGTEDIKRIITSGCSQSVIDNALRSITDAPVNASDFINQLKDKELFDKLLSEMGSENSDALKIEVTTKPPTCSRSNGVITILASKGTARYQYSIDGGKVFSSDKSSFDNLAAGVYTVVVKDAAGDIQRKVIDLKDNSASLERLTMSTYTPTPQAVMGALAVTGELTVQFDPGYTPATVSPVQGVTLTHLSGGIVRLETTLEEYKQWEGEYGAYFKADRNIFAGLYKLDYEEGCSSSGFMSDCKELCFEGFLSRPLIAQSIAGMRFEEQKERYVETTPKTFRMGDVLLTFKPNVLVSKVNDTELSINGQRYTLLVYSKEGKPFAGFYSTALLSTITKGTDGKYSSTDLDRVGGWLDINLYETQNYTRFEENLFAELNDNLFDKIEALFDKIPCFAGDLTFYQDGIVPECLWRGREVPEVSRAAGAIDGAFKMAVGLNELQGMVNNLLGYISEATFDRLGCVDEYHDKLKKIDELEAVLKEKYANKKWYSFMSEWITKIQIEDKTKDVEFCNSYFNFIRTLDVLLTLASEWDNYSKGFDELHESIDKYVESLANGLGENPASLTDEQNHYFGKQVFDIGTIFLGEARVGQVLTDYRMAISALPRLPKKPALELITINSNGIAFRVLDHTATDSRMLYEMTENGVMTNLKWNRSVLGGEHIENLYNVKYINGDGVEVTGNLEIIKVTDSRIGGVYFKVNNAIKAGLLLKLTNNPNVLSLVNRLDEVIDAGLISKIDDIATNNIDKLNKLEELYNPSTFSLPADRPFVNGNSGIKVGGNFSISKNISGQDITVYYNKAGYPEFYQFSPGSEYDFISNSLTGLNGDMTLANNAMKQKFLNQPDKFVWDNQSSWFEIADVNGNLTRYTWHHYQDGRKMFPVPSKIHNSTEGGFNHTGGKAIISKGLQDLFD